MIELVSGEFVVNAWTNGRAHFALTNLGNFWWYGPDTEYKLKWRRMQYDE